jgi:integrase
LQVGTVDQYRTQAAARRGLESLAAQYQQNNPIESYADDGSRLDQALRVQEARQRRAWKDGDNVRGVSHLHSDVDRTAMGKYRLVDVRTAEVEEWLRGQSLITQRGKQLANGTKGKLRSIFSASYAVRWEFASINPITGPSKGAGVRQSAKRRRTPDVLTALEVRKIMMEFQEPHRTLVLLAASTGFRSSELRGLKWQDVDFDACTINLQRGVLGKHIGEMKTASSRHLVPIAGAGDGEPHLSV